MASKRKSTTPCMIPSKVVRPSEEADRDSPVMGCQSRTSGGGRYSPLDPESSKLEAMDAAKDGGGTYTCRPCNFETHDLNLFLDHVYSGHPEFRADPGFICVSCGFSAPKFEGLALHNARVHPSTFATTLQLRKKDRRVVVEQNLLPGTEAVREHEISISKTPIMRMLKGKSEPKRIVVGPPGSDESSSDTQSASGSREADRKETTVHVPTIVHNGTTKVSLPSAIQIVNGSMTPILKSTISQVVSVVQSKNHHSAPVTTSSNVSSPSSSKNLPKVMIPLSSIPTYSASMDSSSFLRTSFSKFPYPTKAELCYLTVVTKYPEEQIKIWFTAQRLKQGISWSPEEIEEARRKMFNTIIQTAPAVSQTHTQTHSPAQHTITVLPASLGATGIPHILQGSLVSQGGVIVTQPVVANGIQVSSAPVALAVTPKPQAAARPMMQARPAAALVADKGISMVVGTVGSSSSGSNNIITSNSGRSGGSGVAGGAGGLVSSTQASVINLSLGGSNLSNAKAGSVNGKHSSAHSNPSDRSNSIVTNQASATKAGADGKSSDISKAGNTSSVTVDGKASNDGQKDITASKDTAASIDDLDSPMIDSPKMDDASSPSSKSSSPSPVAASSGSGGISALLDSALSKSKKSQQQLSALKDSFRSSQFPDHVEVERLISLTGLTVREVRKWFSDRRYHYRNLKGLKGVRGGLGGHRRSGGLVGSAKPVDLSDSGGSSGGSSGAKTPQHSSAPLSPNATLTPTSPTTPSRRNLRAASPDFTAIRYKEREPHQLKALEASFAQDPDPSGEEVDRLRTETKMTRREIHGWFAERRKRVAAEKRREEAERVLREDEEGEEGLRDDGTGAPKVNPIKINLKMLKVTEANGKVEGDGLDLPTAAGASSPAVAPPPALKSLQSSHKLSPSPKQTVVRGKKTADQLHLLKQIYARTQWPSAAQYDELISATGLPRPEVVRWFGDCRYVQKNSQLKWLEAYQNMALEEELQKGNEQILQDQLSLHGGYDDSKLQDLAQASGLTTDLVRFWFSVRASLPRTPQTTSAHSTGPKPAPVVAAAPAEPTAAAGPSAPGSQPGTRTEEKMEQSLCGAAQEANKTVNPGKGTD